MPVRLHVCACAHIWNMDRVTMHPGLAGTVLDFGAPQVQGREVEVAGAMKWEGVVDSKIALK